jgi:hypothetical protein
LITGKLQPLSLHFLKDEDIESLLEYHGFGLRQYEELYLVKEGPFLNSETDFPSGCSQLVHSKKSQRIVVDVSSGPVCAPMSKKDTSVSYSSRLSTGKRDLFPSLHAPVVPHDGRKDLSSLFSGPVSTTPGKHISSLFPNPFSPKAANKLFSPTRPSPLIPNAGREDSVSFFPSAASPQSSKREIFSKTQKVASPKAEAKPKLTDHLTAEDKDSGLAGSPKKVEMQTEILWSQANTENNNALAEPFVSHSHADSMFLDYSNMLGDEDKVRVDMDMGTPVHEVLFIEPGSPIGSPSSVRDGYEDHNISSSTVDDCLPVVTSPKRQISDEKLKAILRLFSILYLFMFPLIGFWWCLIKLRSLLRYFRKWSQRAADKRFLREQKNALAVEALCSLSLGPPVHNTTMVSHLKTCYICFPEPFS